MSRTVRRAAICVSAFCLFVSGVRTTRAAVYLPMPDRELAMESPVIVVARVVDQTVTLESIDGTPHPFTVTTLEALDTVKGDLSGRFQTRLPGGIAGGLAWKIPGTPEFSDGSEVVLFLAPLESRGAGVYRLTEFGLSKFDVVTDEGGRRYAVRPVFNAETDDHVSRRAVAPSPAAARTDAAPSYRELDSFLSALRAIARGQAAPQIRYSAPQGELRASASGARPMFVNIGGREPGDCGGTPCLFRWFWDTGESPDGVLTVVGTQSNLSDGSNGVAHVQNTSVKWSGIAGTDVRYSGPTTSGISPASTRGAEASAAGNVTVKLDVNQSDDTTTWTTSLGCNQSGILGLGGPEPSPPAKGPFKGDANYYTVHAGKVQMRTIACATTKYSASVFRSAVLHEVGHTLGLGHPDQAQSTHSTTTSADWNNAVMRSFIPASNPDSPQTDDIAAILFYYGRPGASICTPGATTLCLNNGRFKVEVRWTSSDGTTGAGQAVGLTGDTGYFWFFSASNVEMVIKVVDGRGFNGKFWVFAGGLTNVNAVITVTDSQTGAVKTYVNPQGTPFAPIQDTAAFSASGITEAGVRTASAAIAGAADQVSADLARLVELSAEPPQAQLAEAFVPKSTAAACVAGATTLCLNNGRFKVEVRWTSSDGTTGAGQAVTLTGDTGYFWFFSASNVEMVIKVVDGRAFNGKFWVFAGGLTNVNAVITVTDSQNGVVKTYVNPQGTPFAPIQDTSAFFGS